MTCVVCRSFGEQAFEREVGVKRGIFNQIFESIMTSNETSIPVKEVFNKVLEGSKRLCTSLLTNEWLIQQWCILFTAKTVAFRPDVLSCISCIHDHTGHALVQYRYTISKAMHSYTINIVF